MAASYLKNHVTWSYFQPINGRLDAPTHSLAALCLSAESCSSLLNVFMVLHSK